MDYIPLNCKKEQLCLNKCISRRSRSSSDSSTDNSSSSRDSSSSSNVSESDSTSNSSFSSSSFTTCSSSDRTISSSSIADTTSSSTSSSNSNTTRPDSISTTFENSEPMLSQSCEISKNNNLRKSKSDESAKDLKIVFKPLKLSRLGSPKQFKNENSSTSKGCRIYVSNLTNNVTKEHLREIFSKYGIIKELDLPLDVFTKLSKGFSYIEYCSPVEALTAVRQMNGGQIDGHEIICMPMPSSMRVGRDDVSRKFPARNYRKMSIKQQSPPRIHGSASYDYNY